MKVIVAISSPGGKLLTFIMLKVIVWRGVMYRLLEGGSEILLIGVAVHVQNPFR